MKVVANELIPVYETETGGHVVDGRELHEFLEVGRDFTNWIKDRIQKYGFIEGEDFTPILAKTPTGGRPSTEYILKLDTAKEIAMVENNEQGSKARKYFIEVEKRFKSYSFDVSQLSPELQMFKQIWDGQAKAQIEQAETQRQLQKVEIAVTTIKETIIQRDDDWRKSINTMFNNAVKNSTSKDFQAIRNESYRILEERAHCDLNTRQRNLRTRMSENGATKTQIDKISKMEVIEVDPKLKEIYTSIIKELSIRALQFS